MPNETVIFGAGCFWGVEARFAALPGVLDTTVGYAGGTTTEPSYKDVCTGTTGHAEVVQVSYNPDRISFSELLETFFELHNPTQPYLNAGQKDRSQYRSLILTSTAAQSAAARERIAEIDASGTYPTTVVTQVLPAGAFWRAEDYHQRYLEKRNMA